MVIRAGQGPLAKERANTVLKMLAKWIQWTKSRMIYGNTTIKKNPSAALYLQG